MHWRSFLAGLVCVVAVPLTTEAQPVAKVARIGCVSVGWDIGPIYEEAFRDGLRESGFTIGQNATMEYRWLGDRLAPAPDPVTRPVTKATLIEALREREQLHRAGWFS